MTKAAAELALAEARVVTSAASVVAQTQALKIRARRLVSSPLVIGGLLTTVAALGYFAYRRSSRPREFSYRPVVHGDLGSVLKTAQILLPLLGVATAALKRNQDSVPPVIPKPEGVAQKLATLEPRAALLQGNWLSQQGQMIKAAVNAWIDDFAPSMGAALSYYTLF